MQTFAKSPQRIWSATVGSFTSRYINGLLAFATLGAVTTGLTSWAAGDQWGRTWTFAHATFGISILLLTPYKSRRSVKTGFRRGRSTRWVSALFGIVILATIVTGLSHSSGIWAGVGYWTSLWTHFLLAFVVIPTLLWHMLSRPAKLNRTDLDRRAFLGTGVIAGAAAATVITIDQATRLAGLRGADRRFTGSHEIGSFDPSAMPATVWIDDSSPPIPAEGWGLRIRGAHYPIEDVWSQATQVEASLDCTGGWYSTQHWDCVSIADLLGLRPDDEHISFKVTSATGYNRTFPMRDAANVFVAVGYGGQPLARRHGAPLRIIAPGRRGPWWIKWVTEIEPSNRRWWLQFPFPTT